MARGSLKRRKAPSEKRGPPGAPIEADEALDSGAPDIAGCPYFVNLSPDSTVSSRVFAKVSQLNGALSGPVIHSKAARR